MASLRQSSACSPISRSGGGFTEDAPRNCAFQASAHRALLTEDIEKVAVPPSTVEAPGINILPYVLLPLAGPEEFDLEVRA